MRELLKTEHLSVSFFTKSGEVEAVRDAVSYTHLLTYVWIIRTRFAIILIQITFQNKIPNLSLIHIYKNWKNENLIFYRTDQDTNEKHYYSNFVGIVRWADKMLLSLPKSVKLDQSEGYLKKLEMLKVYAKLLDLYLADVWEAAERNQKCKPKKAPWNMVSQSVEQWCAQTEKEQADTAEVQIIAAVKFEKV